MNINRNDYEEVRPYLICRLMQEDEAALSQMPQCRAFEDLMLVPFLLRTKEGNVASAVPVRWPLMKSWNVSEAVLMQDAFANMQRVMKVRLERMGELMQSDRKGSVRDVLKCLLRSRFPETSSGRLDQVAGALAQKVDEQIRAQSRLKPMWVLGNQYRLFGAVSVLYEGELERFAGMVDSSFFILPASIHEMILLPEGGNETREMLYDMVASANSRMQDGARRLSNSVYYYDREKKVIQTL